MTSRPDDYTQTKNKVLQLQQGINSKWSSPRVFFYEFDTMTCTDRIALWKKTNVFVNSCIRLGVSTLPMEYLVVQRLLHPDSPGQAVLSEFAPYSRVLNGSIIVNPWKVGEVVDAFEKAMVMKSKERMNRSDKDISFIEKNDLAKWTCRMLSDIDNSVSLDSSMTYMGLGFGFGYRVLHFGLEFMKLNEQSVILQYKASSRRLIVLDYGGTITTTENNDEYMHHGAMRDPINSSVQEALSALCDHPDNVVFIMSSTSKVSMETAFAGIHPKLGLISDNGYYYRKSGKDVWQCLACHEDDLAWKQVARNLMDTYAVRTNGAIVLEKSVSVLYDFHQADPEYGELQANELSDHLTTVLKVR